MVKYKNGKLFGGNVAVTAETTGQNRKRHTWWGPRYQKDRERGSIPGTDTSDVLN